MCASCACWHIVVVRVVGCIAFWCVEGFYLIRGALGFIWKHCLDLGWEMGTGYPCLETADLIFAIIHHYLILLYLIPNSHSINRYIYKRFEKIDELKWRNGVCERWKMEDGGRIEVVRHVFKF